MSPPFLKRFPLADAITTGLIEFDFIMVGAWAKSARGATATVKPAAALERTNRRLFISYRTTAGPSVAIRTFVIGYGPYSRFFMKARPEADFRYFSKLLS